MSDNRLSFITDITKWGIRNARFTLGSGCGSSYRLCRLSYKFVAIVVIGLICSACDKMEDQRVLKLAHSLDATHPVHKAMAYMSDRLEEISRGSMGIDIYPNSQLGSEREQIELLQIGSLAMTKVSTSPLESFVSELKVFSIPYIFQDHDHFWQVLNSDIGRELLLAPESVRLRGLGYYDAGSRSFYSTDKPIHNPDDLGGLKIRVMKSQTAVKTVESLGGAATPISWGELYTALQQGVVDGAENNPPTFFSSKHFEVSRYYTLDEHTSIPDILLISRDVWQSLNQQQQSWLQQAVDESIVFQRELWGRETREALQVVEKAGIQVIIPDKKPFQQAVTAMHDSYDGTDTALLLQRIKAMGHSLKGRELEGSGVE